MPRSFMLRKRINLREPHPQAQWRPDTPPPSPEDDVKDDQLKSANPSERLVNKATASPAKSSLTASTSCSSQSPPLSEASSSRSSKLASNLPSIPSTSGYMPKLDNFKEESLSSWTSSGGALSPLNQASSSSSSSPSPVLNRKFGLLAPSHDLDDAGAKVKIEPKDEAEPSLPHAVQLLAQRLGMFHFIFVYEI